MAISMTLSASQQTSSLTAQDIADRAREYLDEPTRSFFSDDETFLPLINEGIMDIAVKTKCYTGKEDVTLVSNTLEYQINTEYLSVLGAVYYDTAYGHKGLLVGNIEMIGHTMNTIDEPAYWYEFGGKVGFIPVVSGIRSGSKVSLYLAKRPSAIALTGNVPLPSMYDTALIFYVVAHAFMKRQEETGLVFLREYKEAADIYRKDHEEKKTSKLEDKRTV